MKDMDSKFRYAIDERVGCIAVIDRMEECRTPGLSVSLPHVMALWSGERDEDGNWNVPEWAIQKARELNRVLNSTTSVDFSHVERYDKDYGDSKLCECEHQYHRHFDSYEDMSPVGCKYCDCDTFREKQEDPVVTEDIDDAFDVFDANG